METKNNVLKAEVHPIGSENMAKVATFLNAHMSSRFSPEQWQKCLSQTWGQEVPNHGFALVDESGQIVGALCALYSRQIIAGQKLNICNPHSWCVLPQYRKQSISLVLAAIGQKNYHFTMFTPNQSGLEIFAYLRFKPLNRDLLVVPNIPSHPFSRTVRFISDIHQAKQLLSENDRQILTDHQQFDWLLPVVFTANNQANLILIKIQKYKRAKSAQLLYVSDYKILMEYWAQLRTYLFLKYFILTTRLEKRFLADDVALTGITEQGQQRFILSDTIDPEQIQYIYSEMVALKL